MKQSSYDKPDYTFGQAMLTLRTTIGLTQAGLAERLGVSRRAVGDWEGGFAYPKTERLKALLAFAYQQQAFTSGHEAEEIRAFWKVAHQKVLLNESWLSALLNRQSPPPALVPIEEAGGAEVGSAPTPSPTGWVQASQPGQSPPPGGPVASRASSDSGPRVEWGEALDVPSFYGRQEELATLAQWVVQARCRVVSVLGLGGIGKSALVTSSMRQMASHFQVVLFRSLRNAPDCATLLEECLSVLAPQLLDTRTADLEQRISQLLEQMRTQRVLLVLDNLESLLLKGDMRGSLRSGYEGYSRLLQRVAETGHQSCVLLTSREKPAALRTLEGRKTLVRSLRLGGLEAAACEQLLVKHELTGSPEERERLLQAYSGNPLALNIVAETIANLFGGEIGPFLSADIPIFGEITELLEEQWGRLSPLEQMLLFWLAILREPVTFQELKVALVAPLAPSQLLEAVDGLRRRSLVERGQRASSFTLQSVVLEYVTARLVSMASEEIRQGQLRLLCEHGLSQARAKEYVRQTQERLLLTPLLAHLESVYLGRAEVEKRLRELLLGLRGWDQQAQGYGPANLVALLRLLRGNLRGLDLSQLTLRGAYLQGVELQDTTLAKALLQECVWTKSFGGLTALATSPNGQYWATGSQRGEVRVWCEAGQRLHLAWRAHTDFVGSLAFSPDDRTLATGNVDGSLKLWEVTSGRLLWSGWHTDNIYCVAFAPDGRTLVSSAGDATVRLWDPRSGTQLETLAHPAVVLEVSWNPDGSRLATGDLQGTIRLWERQPTGSFRCVQTLEGHTNLVRGLAFAPDGSRLASASWDGTVKLWEVGQERSPYVLQTLVGHTERIRCVTWSPDGRLLASSYDNTIRLWEAQKGILRVVLQGHSAGVNGLAFMPDSRSLLSGSDDGTLRLWDVDSAQCVSVLQGYAFSLYDLDWSPDGTKLASAGSDTVVSIWEVAKGSPLKMLRGHRWSVYGVGWSPDGTQLASSGWDNAIRLWEPATGTCVQILRDLDHPDTMFYGVAWSPDGELLASGTMQQGVLVWDMTARSIRWMSRQIPTWIRRVAWSPDGTWLVGGGDDGQVYVWDVPDGWLLKHQSWHHGANMSVAFSPDGSWLASAGSSELLVWAAHSGERVQTLVGFPGMASAVAWSPNEELLISGGSDGMLRWWEVQSGACVRMQEAHQGMVQALKVSPDGRILASCGDDGAIMLWDLHSGEHVRTLRRDRPYERLNITGIRGLTEAEITTLRALGAVETTPEGKEATSL